MWKFDKIVKGHWSDILDFLKRLPGSISQGVCFIVTGREEWKSDRSAATFKGGYFEWSGRRWCWGASLIIIFGQAD